VIHGVFSVVTTSTMTQLMLQVHVVISGKVQGVYYRKWTVENATKLSLNGWVRNCKDGTVEAMFSGKPNAVDHMVNICKSGPSRARVANVEVTTAAGPPKKGFEQLDDKRW
jgi:acylphosphatase